MMYIMVNYLLPNNHLLCSGANNETVLWHFLGRGSCENQSTVSTVIGRH